MSFKRVKVFMLPTNEKAPLWLSKGNTLTLWGKENNNDKLGDNQHLYILSDEEIKVGDWFYADEYSKPEQAKHFDGKLVNGFVVEFCKKIIATTDKSLNVKSFINYGKESGKEVDVLLPQPSQSFIEKYVEEYNKGNIITEVMVEYDYRVKSGTIDEHKKGLAGYEYFELKVNPKDNTITIRKTKDSWNREEVIELMAKAFYTDCRVWKNRYQDWEEVDFDEWIEENL